MAGAQEGLRTTDALDQLFTIRGIKIDEVDRSSLIARDKGLRKAQEYAYQALIEKIVARKDLDRVPILTLSQKLGLIRGIDYIDESRSGRRYLATLNVGFEPAKVSALLAGADIPHVLGAGSGVLVIHGHKINGINYVFEKGSTGLLAWDAVDSINRLRQYKVLSDNLSLRTTIAYENINQAIVDTRHSEKDITYFQALAKKAGSDEAVLITTDYSDLDGILSYRYRMTVSNIFAEGKLSAADLSSPLAAGESLSQKLIELAYNRVMQDVDDIWRSQLLISSSIVGEMTVVLPTETLDILVSIEKSIDKLSLISKWQVLEMSVPVSKASFTYRGREDQLMLALKLSGLKLIRYKEQSMLAPIDYTP